MIRNILSVLGGFSLWAVLWCSGNFAASVGFPDAFGADGSLSDPTLLSGFVLLAAALSLLAGWVTARVARSAQRCAAILAAIQITVGLAVQLAYWELLPVWYHLSFLAVLVPGVLLGARFAGARRNALSTSYGDGGSPNVVRS